MSVRKAGLVAAGALATLFAASPLASAAELSSIPSAPEVPGASAVAPNPCSFTAHGDDASEESSISEDNPANAVAQSPIGGNNSTLLQCSTYGQHNNEGNNQGNLYTVNGEQVPGFPGF